MPNRNRGQRFGSTEPEEVEDPRFAWIFKLNRTILVEDLNKWGLNNEGNVDELRQRYFTTYKSQMSIPPNVQQNVVVENNTSLEKKREMLNQVRRWGLFFNGKIFDDAHTFLNKLKILKNEYIIPDDVVLSAMPELLRDQAYQWLQMSKYPWNSWISFEEDFKSFFFKSDYLDELEDEILNRKQKKFESGKEYILAIQSLFVRHGNFSEEKKLNVMYRNLKPEYKYYVRKEDISSTQDLIRLTENFEKIRYEENQTNRGNFINRNHDNLRTPNNYSPNFQNPGQSRISENRNRIHCYNCGRTGILTRNCACNQNTNPRYNDNDIQYNRSQTPAMPNAFRRNNQMTENTSRTYEQQNGRQATNITEN